jgi:Na+-transporting methylmalonyl-CoA/oxaloacetate decarboxylase gamma subunit
MAMQPTDWGEAFQIVIGGLVAVFFIMSILATTTYLMGKFFQGLDAKKAAAEAASKAAADKLAEEVKS